MQRVATLLLLFGCGAAGTSQATSHAGELSTSAAVDVARAYFEALQAGNVEQAGTLFAENSSVFETGGNEGTWAHYAHHHLGPELESVTTFEASLGDPDVRSSRDGTLAVVAWPLDYTIELQDGRTIESRGTVTFVLLATEMQFRITHLHWSSRRSSPMPNEH